MKTEEDHDAALARIDQLMNAKPETPKEDELDVLVTLVDAYEAKHFPMDAPDPVSAIQFRMEQQRLPLQMAKERKASQKLAALGGTMPDLGVSASQALNEPSFACRGIFPHY